MMTSHTKSATVSHAIDQDLGGRASDPYAIGAVSLLVAAALVLRVRQRRTPAPVARAAFPTRGAW